MYFKLPSREMSLVCYQLHNVRYDANGVRLRLTGVPYHLKGVSCGLAPRSLNAKSVGELSGIA